MHAFELLKQELENAALHSIDESKPYVVECNALDIEISATQNQGDRLVAFMSCTLQGGELHYPAIENEATAIIEVVRKWCQLLLRKTFTLVTNQRSVVFMLDSRHRSKITNNQVQTGKWNYWHRTLTRLSIYRPGKQNFRLDTLS